MLRISKADIKQFLANYWPLLIGAILLFGGIIGLALTTHRPQSHEGGFLSSPHEAKQVATLKDTTPAPAAPVNSAAQSCADNGNGKLLLVSIHAQHIWACDGPALVKDSAVTTGASALMNVDDATPVGTWHIYSKRTNTTLKGCDVNGCWNDPVAYWMPFDDQVGFHDASWQTFPFGSSLYTTGGSHGCVHLPLDFISWVYGWAPIGTTVTVQA